MVEKTQSKLQLSCNLAAQRFANADFSAFLSCTQVAS
nr:MAG TPA: hypothetical protein [Caudoviricetes sp.]DAM29954.1 MAG TPA: hypothetical protein [Caudoviricetes sp.]DAR34683.1 MAG TPA: hypothetical protein [Caudoviricetes sp.]DAV78433.1 MAG TPA: hypothetical protein [Caudoviricetes sp.]